MKTFAVFTLALLVSPLAAAKDFHFSYAASELVAPHEVYTRLEISVARYCRDVNDIRDLRAIQLCNENLLEITIDEIGNPRLTAFHDSDEVSKKS